MASFCQSPKFMLLSASKVRVRVRFRARVRVRARTSFWQPPKFRLLSAFKNKGLRLVLVLVLRTERGMELGFKKKLGSGFIEFI
jgi:hypothetical protein